MSDGRKQAAASAKADASIKEIGVFKIVPLLREIGNLKRVRAAQFDGSFAENFFRTAWRAITASDTVDVRRVALKIAADAVVAAQLGAIDAAVLQSANLFESEANEVLLRAFDASADALDENLKRELRATVVAENFEFETNGGGLQFVELLARQPRSGATKTGAPKLVFDAPENHAEHCASVAIYAVLLAPRFGADIETVFLAALAHHFHNAYLPDAGFAGEEMLGAFLPKIFSGFREKCLSELPKNLREKIRKTFSLIERADAPEAKAFHAADVIDRVLQMRHHAEANEFTLAFAMEEMELVHAGAVQQFHYEILRSARLINRRDAESPSF